MAVGDHTGQMWLSGFNDVGTTLFGMTGNELHEMKVQVRPFNITVACCKIFILLCRTRPKLIISYITLRAIRIVLLAEPLSNRST